MPGMVRARNASLRKQGTGAAHGASLLENGYGCVREREDCFGLSEGQAAKVRGRLEADLDKPGF